MLIDRKKSSKKKSSLTQLLSEGQKKLKKAGLPSARLEAELLFSHAVRKERIWLYKNPQYQPSSKEIKNYRQYLKRRSMGEPQAYIRSYQEFFGRNFQVDSSVLIPRPESEELVALALELSSFSKQSKVLDLCCGSGCIGLSLLLERKNIHLHLSDISRKALKKCRKNARALGDAGIAFSRFKKTSYSYRIYRSDLFEKLPKTSYDLIVANPPYVLADEYGKLPWDIRNYEPKEALYCSQAESFYERLMAGIAKRLKADGYALLESNPRLVPLCKKLALQFSLAAEVRKDLNKKERFLLLYPI